MSFGQRLHLLQQSCRTGLLLIPAALAGIWVAPGAPIVVKSALTVGFLLTLTSACALALSKCPSCRQPFFGPRAVSVQTPRMAVFAPTCRSCGHRPHDATSMRGVVR